MNQFISDYALIPFIVFASLIIVEIIRRHWFE